ncbi:hypothetical protein ACHHYP_00547 [Achlya hypogyna]|uniref:Uncharacterized protein n=1 Tax=Achlya hypogyna TaxID=1202772 RepID=A0A1V9ZU89_ACHHY|nr:hypothetical protein ACHHYP_00547 [Achlya hypogyna]
MQKFNAVFERFGAASGADSVAAKIALEGPSISVTYASLHYEASKLVKVLPGRVVAVALPFGVAQIAVVCSAIMGHKVFVPLDDTQSTTRNRKLLRDAGINCLVCMPTSALLDDLQATQTRTSVFHELIVVASWSDDAATITDPTLADDDAMYVLFTSGSSGAPKGVIGSYSATWNRLSWMWAAHPFAANECVLRQTKLSFVDAVAEILGTLCGGATLVVPSASSFAPLIVEDISSFADIMKTHRVTRLTLVPSVLQLLLQSRLLPMFGDLRYLIVSGEMLHIDLVTCAQVALPQCRLLNLYGSTEVAGDVSCWVATTNCTRVSIGSAIANTTLRLVDVSGAIITSDDVPGELWVAGAGLALGYLNRPEEYKARFQTVDGVRWFKTGDVCVWQSGLLYLSGRLDDFVKIAGVQVHLQAVEATARAFLSQVSAPWRVVAVAVVSLGGWHQYDTLVVCVGIDGGSVDTDALLRTIFIDHPTVPAHVFCIALDAFPQTSSGKADRKQVAALFAARSRADTSWLATLLPAKWPVPSELSPSMTLTELGLHSMALAMVLHTLQTDYGVHLRLVDLIGMTLEQLEHTIAHSKRPRESPVPSRKRKRTDPQPAQLRCQWEVQVGKCIDASPRLAVTATETYVVVGSHDHHVLCINAKNGGVKWRIELPDRVEASAAIGAYRVVVGCYDGGIYCLDLFSGEVQWQFATKDQVKCSPLIVAEKAAVVCGSHDHHVYGLDLNSGRLLFTIPFPKSVFSTPAFNADVLYCASLSGDVRAYAWPALLLGEPTPLWSYTLTAPVFCSLRCSPVHNVLLVGCADAALYGFSLEGAVQWTALTAKPIFSSPSLGVVDGRDVAVFGSHDGVVRCVSIATGECIAKLDVGCAVFASPAVFDLEKQPSVCVCTTDGRVFVWKLTAAAPTTATFCGAGDIFSSPVVWGDTIFVGTRGDRMLALALDTTASSPQ